MKVFSIFQSEMTRMATVAELEREVSQLLKSLRRRDRRIAFLKRQLRATRQQNHLDLRAAREIIAGLEDMLLMRKPRSNQPAEERIAELESQLAEMTHLAETLYQRSGS